MNRALVDIKQGKMSLVGLSELVTFLSNGIHISSGEISARLPALHEKEEFFNYHILLHYTKKIKTRETIY